MPASEKTKRRVTLRDVAEASGVSPSTVSFVLNEVPNQTIPEGTRTRVKEAAIRLGYVPHGIARALMEGTSRVVVLNIEPKQEGNYSRSYIRGFDKELALYGFVLLVRQGHQAPSDVKEILDVISPRAVVNFGDAYSAGHELDDSGGGWKNGMAAHVLLQIGHLFERGHTAIAYGLPDKEPLGDVRTRFVEKVATLLEIPPVVTYSVPAESKPRLSALKALRSAHPEITAIATFDDMSALRTLEAMRQLGLEAPEDLAVIGFDESEFAELATPSLTTVRADAEGHGRIAARRALGLDAGDIETHLGCVIERESA